MLLNNQSDTLKTSLMIFHTLHLYDLPMKVLELKLSLEIDLILILEAEEFFHFINLKHYKSG